MAGLSHQNIVRLIGFVEELERGKAWIILAWEANGNLSEFLASGDWEILERVSLVSDALPGRECNGLILLFHLRLRIPLMVSGIFTRESHRSVMVI